MSEIKNKFNFPESSGRFIGRKFNSPGKRSIAGDIKEEFYEMVKSNGFFKARIWYIRQFLLLGFTFLINSVYWSFTMFKNYIKIAFRNIIRHKGYSFINIAGLTIGIACFCLILLYVDFEFSYDKFHPDNHRLFRVGMEMKTTTSELKLALTSVPLIPELKENFPEIKYGARIRIPSEKVVKAGKISFNEKRLIFADSDVFNIFKISFIAGNPERAINEPGKIVITEITAYKYFGSDNPMGKRISIDNREYEITGIIKNSPDNTHLKYDLIAGIGNIPDSYLNSGNWSQAGFYAYVKLSKVANYNAFESKLRKLGNEYINRGKVTNLKELSFFLQPVSKIHLYSNLSYEIEPPGNPVYVRLLSAVGILVLFIACINFTNLSTAGFTRRLKEIGIRKVIGVERKQIIRQFMGEYLFAVFTAFILALILLIPLMPYVNNITGINLTVNNFFKTSNFFILILLIPIIAFLAGGYPAVFISRFDTVNILRGTIFSSLKRGSLRKIFVFIQFLISTTLIFITIVISNQLIFMKTKPLGFAKEQKLIIPFQDRGFLYSNYRTIKSEFSDIPGVTGVTVSSTVPGRQLLQVPISLSVQQQEIVHPAAFLFVDYDFLTNYGINLSAGRNFDPQITGDFGSTIMINEAAVKAFGWNLPENALQKRIKTGLYGEKSEIIGVIKDFHFEGLQTPIKPLVIDIFPQLYSMVTLTINAENPGKILSSIEKKYKELLPSSNVDYFFLDADFNRQYISEQRTSRICLFFTLFGILITCIGLLGLTSFMVEKRQKEIGIRKVLGATVSGITFLLTKEFLLLVILSSLASLPFAYYVSNKWLQGFAYRTDIEFRVFAGSVIITLFIAVITVSYKTIKAAILNPVETIKYE